MVQAEGETGQHDSWKNAEGFHEAGTKKDGEEVDLEDVRHHDVDGRQDQLGSEGRQGPARFSEELRCEEEREPESNGEKPSGVIDSQPGSYPVFAAEEQEGRHDAHEADLEQIAENDETESALGIADPHTEQRRRRGQTERGKGSLRRLESNPMTLRPNHFGAAGALFGWSFDHGKPSVAHSALHSQHTSRLTSLAHRFASLANFVM